MSTLFGPVVQQGYVVPDVEKAIAHWLARGDFYDMYFVLMKQAADDWDGHTDPIRMLDMSSGAPKAVPYSRA